MDHVGLDPVALVVLIGQLEPLGQVEVELHGRALPSPAQSVGDVDVNLGSVERAAAFVDAEGQPTLSQRPAQGSGRMLPHIVVSDGFLRTGGYHDGILGESEGLKKLEGQVQHAADLVLDLVRAAEYVGVVLGEAPDPHQAVEHAAPFVAVHRSEFAVSQW